MQVLVCNGLLRNEADAGSITNRDNKSPQGIVMAAYQFTVSVKTQYLAEQSEPDRSS